jgi:hypothetical protein
MLTNILLEKILVLTVLHMGFERGADSKRGEVDADLLANGS